MERAVEGEAGSGPLKNSQNLPIFNIERELTSLLGGCEPDAASAQTGRPNPAQRPHGSAHRLLDAAATPASPAPSAREQPAAPSLSLREHGTQRAHEAGLGGRHLERVAAEPLVAGAALACGAPLRGVADRASASGEPGVDRAGDGGRAAGAVAQHGEAHVATASEAQQQALRPESGQCGSWSSWSTPAARSELDAQRAEGEAQVSRSRRQHHLAEATSARCWCSRGDRRRRSPSRRGPSGERDCAERSCNMLETPDGDGGRSCVRLLCSQLWG